MAVRGISVLLLVDRTPPVGKRRRINDEAWWCANMCVSMCVCAVSVVFKGIEMHHGTSIRWVNWWPLHWPSTTVHHCSPFLFPLGGTVSPGLCYEQYCFSIEGVFQHMLTRFTILAALQSVCIWTVKIQFYISSILDLGSKVSCEAECHLFLRLFSYIAVLLLRKERTLCI